MVEKTKTVRVLREEIDHPDHYQHPTGIECIDVIEHMPFNIGTAVKHLWRCGQKWDDIGDLKKAVWYINRQIQKLEAEKKLQSQQ